MTTVINGTSTSASAPAVVGDDGDTGVYYPAANQVALATAGSQAMLIDGSKNVSFGSGVNVDAYQGTSPANGVFMGTVAGPSFFLATQTATNTNLYLSKSSAYTDGGYIRFYNNTTATGTVSLVSNTVAMSNISQIQFPASQVASSDPNTLDDYEEGTWTPVLSNTGFGGSWTVVVGRYVKIGRTVTCWMSLDGGSSGGGTGNLVVQGLPFTYENTGNWLNFGIWNGSGSVPNGPIIGNGSSTTVNVWSGGGYVTETKSFFTASFSFRATS